MAVRLSKFLSEQTSLISTSIIHLYYIFLLHIDSISSHLVGTLKFIYHRSNVWWFLTKPAKLTHERILCASAFVLWISWFSHWWFTGKGYFFPTYKSNVISGQPLTKQNQSSLSSVCSVSRSDPLGSGARDSSRGWARRAIRAELPSF